MILTRYDPTNGGRDGPALRPYPGANWTQAPPTLGGVLILDGRIEIGHRGSAHIAAVIGFVIRAAAVQRASVVPDNEIARRPFVGLDELRLSGVFH